MNDSLPAEKAAAPGSALTSEHFDILYHTQYVAAGGLYCGGGKEMDELEAQGLMQFIGRKSFVPDPYYGITAAGRKVLRERNKTAKP
jgi:hypothetical protein